MEKAVLDRRLAQMEAEGTRFRSGVDVGDEITGQQLVDRYDAVVLAIGATVPRDLAVPGRELDSVHQAMEYLPQGNLAALGRSVPDQILATDRDVVIIGGDDTGADCLGTAHRRARSVTQLEILPRPTEEALLTLADVPDDLPHLQCPRGGRRPRLRGQHRSGSSATRTVVCGR